MPLTPDFKLDAPIKSLRPMPLSQHSICGGCFVLRHDGVAVRINELAMLKPSTYLHRLLGPFGEVAVRIQTGAYGENAYALRMREPNGQIVSFMTTLRHLSLDRRHLIEVQRGQVFNGLRVTNGIKEYEQHLEVIEVRPVENYAHYSYSVDPCALYIGAGKKPVFLPFEVT